MLTEISTFGWFKDTAVTTDLLAISTFGWFVVDGELVSLGLFQDHDGLFDGGLWF